MEKEVGGGIGMGNTCKPTAVSFQCMTKFTTNIKKKKRKIRDTVSIPRSGRSTAVGDDNPLHYSYLKTFHGQKA